MSARTIRKARRSVLALALVSTFTLLPALSALPRPSPPRVAAAAQRWDNGWTFQGLFWHLLTALRARSGAKIDGNG
jgi:hypothetical protein